MVSEDFSFPKITNSTPQFTFSPSVWLASSSVFPSLDDSGEREADLGRKSSFPCPETREEEKDKMDMLWEDFNDKELNRVCSKERNKNRGAESKEYLNGRDDNMVVEICSKRGIYGRIIHHHQQKRRKMGFLVEVLIRKLFSTKNNSSRRINSCVWAPQSRV
ncbi:hypothetical protein HS088_TW22G01325 [Tripterygium wilfordii]|uniref:Uncharacterized protein n=1 Tax=Tripterygium wilfordii TaxID=458696 RepID=A0A7J7C0E2_TRIWF|nr:hypothetical protein HS088_TW22G01325 [Tripterygium wilfordii]